LVAFDLLRITVVSLACYVKVVVSCLTALNWDCS
jgi:hypothetical protein